MKLAEVIETLQRAEPALRPHGILHAAVFGSVARDEARKDSDIDIALDLDADKVRTVFDYAHVKNVVEDLFDHKVDVVDRSALKPRLREHVERDLVYAF